MLIDKRSTGGVRDLSRLDTHLHEGLKSLLTKSVMDLIYLLGRTHLCRKLALQLILVWICLQDWTLIQRV